MTILLDLIINSDKKYVSKCFDRMKRMISFVIMKTRINKFLQIGLAQLAYWKVHKQDRQAWIYEYDRKIWTKDYANKREIALMVEVIMN